MFVGEPIPAYVMEMVTGAMFLGVDLAVGIVVFSSAENKWWALPCGFIALFCVGLIVHGGVMIDKKAKIKR